jgi:hypothetical protein
LLKLDFKEKYNSLINFYLRKPSLNKVNKVLLLGGSACY